MVNDSFDNNTLKSDLLAMLQAEHPTMCRRWFDDIRVLGVTGGVILIQIMEPVQLKYLQRCCVQQFADAAQSVTGRLLGVRFVGDESVEAQPSARLVSGDYYAWRRTRRRYAYKPGL